MSQMKTLESLCHNASFLKTRIALMTFYNIRSPKWFEKVLLAVEYLQLISQALFLQLKSSEYQSQSNQIYFEAVIYLFKLINPSYLFSFTYDNAILSVILLILFGLTLLKYLLAVYIVCIAFWDSPGQNFLISIWRLIFKMQSRITCFFVTSFWAQAILSYSTGDFNLYGMSNTFVIVLCVVLIVIEYIFSFFIEVQLSYVLPTKSFLSSKSYGIQTFTLTQKLLLQIFQLTLNTEQENFWIFSSFNLAFSSIKLHTLYKTLPLYNLKCLLYQANLMSLVTSVNLACFAQSFLVQINYQTNQVNTVLVLWIICAVLICKSYSQLIKKRIINLVTGNEIEEAPSVLIHKIVANKYLREHLDLPTEYTEKYDLTYLLGAVQEFHTKHGLSFHSDLAIIDEVFLKYLESIQSRFPRDEFIKVYIAHFCAKNPKLCFKTIKTIGELKRKRWSKNHLSTSLLLHEVQKTIKNSCQESKENLDVLRYIKSQVSGQQLKKEMLTETDLKITICNNILNDKANVAKIHTCAQLIDKSKKNIEKRMSQLLNDIPDSYIDPLLLWAGYQLILNYSFRFFKKFSNLWRGKQLKYRRFFEEPGLKNENLYQDTNVFLVLSGEKHTNGQIMFCSSFIQDICGGEKKSYYGLHASTLMTPSFQSFYASLLRQITETGQRDLMNNKEKAYIYHKDGHLVEAEVFLSVHPYLTQGLYLNMIIRPIPTTQEYLLIKENGDIEGATQKIGEALGIKTHFKSNSTLVNIKMFSEELYKANFAINFVLKGQQKENAPAKRSPSEIRYNKQRTLQEENSWSSGYNEALELHQTYSSEGKIIELTVFNNSIKSKNYHCQISIINYGSTVMKVVKLTEKGKENGFMSLGQIKLPSKDKVKDCILSEGDELTSGHDSPLESENLDSSQGNEKINLETNNNLKTDANLLVSSPRRPLMSVDGEGGHFPNNTLKQISMKFSDIHRKESHTSDSHRAERIVKVQKSLASSQETSSEQRLYKIFKANLATNTYPKSFKPLCVSFYFVILAALMSQVILKLVTDSTMKDLLLKKNLLNYSQLRSYKADLISVNLYGVMTKILDSEAVLNMSIIQWPPEFIISNANSHEVDLKKYNQLILNNLAPLDDTFKQQILAKDVGMNGTFINSSSADYVTGTSFDAIDILISAMHQLTHLAAYNSTEALELTRFIIKNTLNDFLYKSQEIVHIFVESVKIEREKLQSLLTLVLIVSPVLLASIALVLIVIICHQYSIAKKQLVVFITLDADRVKEILANLNTFKKILTGEGSSDDRHPFNYFFQVASSYQSFLEKTYRKPNKAHRVEFTGIKRKYYGYFFKVIFYILVLIGIMTWNSASAQDFVDHIYWRQRQLEFANHISEMVGTNYLSTVSMAYFNNSSPVKRLSPLDASNLGLAEVKRVRSEMLDVFKELDGTYDPNVKAILLERRSCKSINFTAVSPREHCLSLEKIGLSVDLVSLLTVHESVMFDKIQDYSLYCDKSNQIMLVDCAYGYYNSFILTFVMAAIDAQMIGDIVGANLEKNASKSYTQRNLLLIIFAISFILVSLLTWLQILTRLREVHNEFKKVLQVFPPTLILSSFSLKTFLQKHSKSYLPLPYAI